MSELAAFAWQMVCFVAWGVRLNAGWLAVFVAGVAVGAIAS